MMFGMYAPFRTLRSGMLGLAGCARDSLTEKDRDYVLPADEILAQFHFVVTHRRPQLLVEFGNAFQPAPGTGKGQHISRACNPPLCAIREQSGFPEPSNETKARFMDLLDQLKVPALCRGEMPVQSRSSAW